MSEIPPVNALGVISGHKRIQELEAKLYESEELIDSFLSVLPLIMNVWDEDINLISTSSQAVEMFGLENEEQYIQEFSRLSPEFQPCGSPSGQKAYALVQRAFEDGRVHFEWTHQNLHGDLIPTEIVLVRFVKQGKPFVAAFTFDLRENEALNKFILDSCPMAVEMWDDEKNLLYCNQQTLMAAGVRSFEEYKSRFRELASARQPDGMTSDSKLSRMLDYALEHGFARFEWIYDSPVGKQFSYETQLIRIMRKSNYVVIGYSHDGSQMKKMIADMKEQELRQERERNKLADESNKSKSRFLARMSHEIRTPITAVLGISVIQLQSTNLSPIVAEAFAKIYDSGNLLLNIVNDILDLSKIDSGNLTLTKMKYKVASLVVDVVQPHIVHLGTYDLDFNIHVDPNLPSSIIGDPTRIKQITNNILSNAFKYTSMGSVNLTFTFEESPDGFNLVIITKDTGMGMTQTQLDLIFNEYARFHEKQVGHVSGAGLGMPIVYSLSKIMDAEISLQSKVNKGTTVKISIPHEVADSLPIGDQMAKNLESFDSGDLAADKKFKFEPEPMPYGKVLIVDDIDANLYVAEGLLSFYNLQIETCDSGFSAIDKIRQGNVYDLIFMDHMMPKMTGTQALKQLRSMGYEMPIVVLTANALIGQAEKFVMSGFDDFLSKPIRIVQLNTILHKYIRDKQPPEVLEAARTNAPPMSIVDINSFQESNSLLKKLKSEFYKGQQNAFAEINDALDTGDIKSAHLRAHTIKGLAGMIGEGALVKAALLVESLLEQSKIPPDDVMTQFGVELKRVLKRVTRPVQNRTQADEIDKKKVLGILKDLRPLLENRKSKSTRMLDELRQIPEAAILVKQVEKFDFATAIKSLEALCEIVKFM